MKIIFLLALLGLTTIVHCENWAILVAGSDGYWNYRHQSDTCHAYQILLKGGMKPENIIHFAKNDIAFDYENPFPGKIYNHPDPTGPGVNVFEGCQIDYQGNDVTPQNFLDVIAGKQSSKLKKVLKSTSEDNVFIYFSDHGAPNLIAFPSDELYKKDLWPVLKEMQSKKMYKKLTFYIEACESGSMCHPDKLTEGSDVYCLTAANETQSSYAFYCGDEAIVNGKDIGSCLGDEFSISWMEDTDSNPRTITLQEQFERVKARTEGSHVLQWVNTAFTQEEMGTFIGYGTSQYIKMFEDPQTVLREDNRMTKLNYLKRKMLKNIGDKAATLKYHAELALHNFINKVFNTLAKLHNVTEFGSAQEFDQDCYKNLIDTFQQKCHKIPEHGLANLRIFTHICSKNPKINQKLFEELLTRACANKPYQTQE